MNRLTFGIDEAVECLDKHHADHGVVAVAGVHLASAIKSLRSAMRHRALAARVAGFRRRVDFTHSVEPGDLPSSKYHDYVYQMPDAMFDALAMAFVPRPVLGEMGQTVARIDDMDPLAGFSDTSALGVVSRITQDALGLRYVMGMNEALRLLRPTLMRAGCKGDAYSDGTFVGVSRSAARSPYYRRLTSAEPHFLVAPTPLRAQEVFDVTRATLIMASVMGEFK